MEETTHVRVFAFIQSGLFLLLLLLLLVFNKGSTLVYGSLSLVLLIAYHLIIDYRFTTSRLVSSGLISAYVGVYLLLCALVVWNTKVPGRDESNFWIIYFLPITIAAAHLKLRGTLITCTVALGLFVAHLPARMYLDPRERVEELPELIGFGIMFFLVGILVQTFAQQNRLQLTLKQQLNDKLLENQQHLRDSLERLETAEESLRTKARLASLGELSAGIAHEIRNPLGIISSSAQLLDREVANLEARELLEIIKEESSRLNGLITEFLTFGRQNEPQRQPCNLKILIAHAIDTIQNSAQQKKIALDLDSECSTCTASVDADMMQQVLLNLLLNALEATAPGGRIHVALQQYPERLDIVISDSGRGIPEQNLARVFDPFFTTKSDGTGLGLANAYKIMESHGGSLKVASRVGEGSIFTASLPLENS